MPLAEAHVPLVASSQTAVSADAPSSHWGKRVPGLLLAVVVCNAVGILGALTTTPDTSWYTSLEKPAFQPPGWLFGPVWTLLYSMMGVAAFRVFERRQQPGAKLALGLFGAQLVLNGLWSPIFFGAQAIAVALGVIITLLAVVVATTQRFYRLDRASGALLVPYVAWLCFATVLNASILALN